MELDRVDTVEHTQDLGDRHDNRGHARLDARSTDVRVSSQDNAAGGRGLDPARQDTCPSDRLSVTVGDICVCRNRN